MVCVEAAVAPSRGSFKDYCRGGKEAINLCLQNGIQLSFKAFRIFWKMISFCLLIFPCGHIDSGVREYVQLSYMHVCVILGYLKSRFNDETHSFFNQTCMRAPVFDFVLLSFNYSQFPGDSSVLGAISWNRMFDQN